MGVTSMWEYVQKFVQPVNISVLRNKRIAIDGHTWLCEVLRGSVAHCSTTRKPYLSTFYTRCRSLLEEGVEPIVVFDGIDEGERTNIDYGISSMRKVRKRGSKYWTSELKQEMVPKVEEIKMLLNSMGVRWMESKLEGEAQCAQLEQRGLVDFGFGGKIQNNILHLSMDYLDETLCLSRSCLIAMTIMIGCDYAQKGIPGVGLVTALEIVSEFYLMKHDHPQVILDRFKSYTTEMLPVRDYDSNVKRKLRLSVNRNSIDLRNFNPNSDAMSNAINIYLMPVVIEYSRTQLPKKLPPNIQKTEEILMRECNWKPNGVNCTQKLQSDAEKVEKSATLTKAGRTVCSKRERVAMERLRMNALLYKHSPVIEVISVPSTSEDVNQLNGESSGIIVSSQRDSIQRSGRKKGNHEMGGVQQPPPSKIPRKDGFVTKIIQSRA
ncbi:XPG N-terminal domain containing protein [Brugia malayi]|uniref:XPG N-terminal domain containing protein n=1 Tax=Brugia malayi TaxID=6279 RepID=A0A4E9F9T3_BRUMA|nr:XPG N-terminal domain containing protein [Brugia malayi]VIO90610.1 XPG N-terminal domain containing protein [Brugia malayi]